MLWRGPDGPGQAKVTNMKYQIDDGFRPPATGPGRWEVAVVPGARVGRDLLWAPACARCLSTVNSDAKQSPHPLAEAQIEVFVISFSTRWL